jgi:glycosyltransferase involved in cell wall biosynthesis
VKFSIVTPVLNVERFIVEALESVASQRGSFEIEHIVIDGASTDSTVERVERFAHELRGRTLDSERHELSWISEPDTGLWQAVNRGFARASGDVVTALMADEAYLPGAFAAVAEVFECFTEVRWLKGTTAYFNEDSVIYDPGEKLLYDRGWLRDGAYGRELYFVQWPSTFWRSDLHQPFDESLRLAGDYRQWIDFAEETELYALPAQLCCFRKRPGQLSEDTAGYARECESVRPPGRTARRRFLRRYMRLERRLPSWLQPPLGRLAFPGRSFPMISRSPTGELSISRQRYHRPPSEFSLR